MAKLIVKDKSGVLEKIARRLIKREEKFKLLDKIKDRILFVWRLGDTPRYDDEGRTVAGRTRVLPKRERDVYGYDVEIEIFKQSWQKRGPKARKRLIWHELRHIEIAVDENFRVLRDDDGRIQVKMVEHDVVVTTFEDETRKFGLAPKDIHSSVVLAKALKKYSKKKQSKLKTE